MRVLGIDPGLVKTGWGIIEREGATLRYVASGLIKPPVKVPLPQRLSFLHMHITDVLNAHKPETAAVEETFVNKNPASALKLGQARGVCVCAPALYGIEVGEYSANKIKKSIVGSGHAAKQQMMMMVKMLLPKSGDLSEDEADALAVAITHAHHL